MATDTKPNLCRYINRELSWLDFNQRVLDEATSKKNPLLERLKFLAITGGNLDEFFMVRVGGLHLVLDTPQQIPDPTGLLPEEQLATIASRVEKMVADQYRCLDDLTGQLVSKGIKRVQISELSGKQVEYLENWFQNKVQPVISPIALDFSAQDAQQSTSNFPLLTTSPLNLLVRLKNDPQFSLNQFTGGENDQGLEDRFVVLPLGSQLPRFITIPADGEFHFAMVEEVVEKFVGDFFPNQEVLECIPFRLTRNADMRVDEDGASDLLHGMQKILTERKESGCVRLEIPAGTSEAIKSFLKTVLQAEESDIFLADGPLQIKDWMSIATMPGHADLKNDPWPVQPASEFPADKSIFEVISQSDRLLYHPYQEFDPVVRMVQQAAEDPQVLSIKHTLYRTSKNSPIIMALEQAALAGKDVTVILELKARFDEARNIQWAKRLERAGVHVIYGVRGLKIHAKVLVVVRNDSDRLRRYVHFGTGNYNESTASLYSDVSYFTCNNAYGNDAIAFFNAIAGMSTPQTMQKLSMAPFGIREKLMDLIRVETENAKRGLPSGIVAKINSLADTEMIDALYEASQAGVPIKLNIRGICCLRPGVGGLSETIDVVSVIDRYLEHARILQFEQGGNPRVFITSADWMGRNLDRRVELLVPVENKRCRDRLIKILSFYFQDNVKALSLQSDASYQKVPCAKGAKKFQSQKELQAESALLVQAVENESGMFHPYTGESE